MTSFTLFPAFTSRYMPVVSSIPRLTKPQQMGVTARRERVTFDRRIRGCKFARQTSEKLGGVPLLRILHMQHFQQAW